MAAARDGRGEFDLTGRETASGSGHATVGLLPAFGEDSHTITIDLDDLYEAHRGGLGRTQPQAPSQPPAARVPSSDPPAAPPDPVPAAPEAAAPGHDHPQPPPPPPRAPTAAAAAAATGARPGKRPRFAVTTQTVESARQRASTDEQAPDAAASPLKGSARPPGPTSPAPAAPAGCTATTTTSPLGVASPSRFKVTVSSLGDKPAPASPPLSSPPKAAVQASSPLGALPPARRHEPTITVQDSTDSAPHSPPPPAALLPQDSSASLAGSLHVQRLESLFSAQGGVGAGTEPAAGQPAESLAASGAGFARAESGTGSANDSFSQSHLDDDIAEPAPFLAPVAVPVKGKLPADVYEYHHTVFGQYKEKLANEAVSYVRSKQQPEVVRPHQNGFRALELKRSSHFSMPGMPRHLQLGTGVFLFVFGVVVALFEFALDRTINELLAFRKLILDVPSRPAQGFLWTLYVVVLTGIAMAAVRYIGPAAANSGIPQLKVIMSTGIRIRKFFGYRTLVAKTIGVVASVGGGLFLGREGPFVHIASIIGVKLLRLPWFRSIRQCGQQFILGAAAALGAASTFRAPIGGILFSIEVTAVSYFISNYWKSYVAAAIGLVAVFLVVRRSDFAFIPTQFGPFPFEKAELVAIAVLGVICGVLGSAWVHMFRAALRLQRRARPWPIEAPQSIGLILAAITGVVIFFLGSFLRVPLLSSIADLFKSVPLSSPELNATNWTDGNLYLNLFLYSGVIFFLAPLHMTLPLPTGAFLPCFAAGAGVGRLFGEVMADIFPGHGIDPAVYAVCGAAGMNAALTRAISTSVVMFEITQQITIATPIVLVVLVSISVANKLSVSLFDTALSEKKLPYLPTLRFGGTELLVAKDVMDAVPMLPRRTVLSDVIGVLRGLAPDQNVIAVVDSMETRFLLGSIQVDRLRTHVETLYRASRPKRSSSSAGARLEVPEAPGVPRQAHLVNQITVRSIEHLKRLWGSLPLPFDDRFHIADLSEADLRAIERDIDMYATDIGINPAPLQFVEATPLTQVIFLFSALHSRFAFVTEFGAVVGILTVKCLSAKVGAKQQSLLPAVLRRTRATGAAGMRRTSSFFRSPRRRGASEPTDDVRFPGPNGARALHTNGEGPPPLARGRTEPTTM